MAEKLSFNERLAAWYEVHLEYALKYRAVCQRYLPAEEITKIDKELNGVRAVRQNCHWWKVLLAVAPHEAQQMCDLDHQDVWERGGGHCHCCGLVMTTAPSAPPPIVAQPTKTKPSQLALDI